MSEPTIPFQGQTAVMDRPGPVPGLGDEPEPGGGDNRTKLLALGGVAAVLVLAVVAYLLLFSGGGDAALDEGVPAPAPPAAADVSEPDEAAVLPLPKLSNKTFGKDPFKPLIVEPAAAVAPAASDTGTTGSTTVPVLPGAGTGSEAPAAETSTPAQSTAHTFKVVDVAPDNSTISVRVDGKVYRNLKAGDVFATYFKVRLISGQVNSFQFGEEKFNVVGKKKLTIA
jgi:hypothetical protein